MEATMTETQTWQTFLADEKMQPYFRAILDFLKTEQAAGKKIYPPSADIFNAFKYTPFAAVKVVILGQDPYHGVNQAHGLCFSVQPGVAVPPSLQNIFQELHNDVGAAIPQHGCLSAWAQQGVLLLNTVMTVEAGKPQSHANKGWESFTDKVIRVLSEEKDGLVFLLWGAPAQRKAQLIDRSKHYLLTAPHPSPLSAHRGFFGCKHFSKTNALLRQMGRGEINWAL